MSFVTPACFKNTPIDTPRHGPLQARLQCKPLGISLLAVSLAIASSNLLAADEPAPDLTFTGHIDLVSAYYLRGATTTYGNVKPGLGNEGADAPESRRPVLQWGADITHTNGLYAGYWASLINYSYKSLGQSYDYYARGQTPPSDFNFQTPRSVENDFYGGYNGTIGDFGYTAGMTAYYYFNGKHSNGLETKLAASYAGVTFSAQTLLNDTVWGNRGDTYFLLNYSYALPYKITATASLGAYYYTKEGKYLGTHDPLTGTSCPRDTAFVVNGCFSGAAPVQGGYRHLILGVSQPIGDTGVTWGLQGILGGVNRYGIRQANRIFGSISYGF
ncbi:MAG: hypothetical protein JWL63_401 [Rhodocyclales bacterium]|nr:hypothetical protein [Rhodocyclales bacterium]